MKRLAVLAAVCLASSAALADQCQWVSAAQAKKAHALLKPGMLVSKYCEPCGDKHPSRPFKIGSITEKKMDATYLEIHINGESEDLAYLYLHAAGDRFDNVAAKVGCPAEGVSNHIDLKHGHDHKQGPAGKGHKKVPAPPRNG